MLDNKTRITMMDEVEKRAICDKICRKHGFELSHGTKINDKHTIIKFFIPAFGSQQLNKGFKDLHITYYHDKKEFLFSSLFGDFSTFDKAESVLKNVEILVKEIIEEFNL